ncbi:MAG: diguanylate cyclase [Eubacterium sp.]|nr:diguanylate cyclase [Eubacterium sp.]
MINIIKRKVIYMVVVSLLILPLCAFFTGRTVQADETDTQEKTTVRVGFPTDMQYMMSRNTQSGDMSGYGYDYLQKVAGYTGWEYEYVEGEWTELWQMLQDGEIDLLEDVSYTKERAKTLLFPDRSIGTELYRLYVLANNEEITTTNYKETLNGTVIGVTGGTYQEDLFRQWVKDNDIDCTIKGYPSDEERNELFGDGELDAVVEIETAAHSTWEPIAEIGSSDFYIALSAGNEDLLDELNEALNNIIEVNPQYNEELYSEYLLDRVISKKLSDGESAWLSENDEIKIGYFDDEESCDVSKMMEQLFTQIFRLVGEKDLAINCIEYTSLEAMESDLQSGDIDVMYPTFDELTLNEEKNATVVAEIEPIKINGILPEGMSIEEVSKIGINNSGLIQHYIETFYPDVTIVSYEDVETLIKAVTSGEVDAGFSEGITPSTISSSKNNVGSLSIIGNSETYHKCLAVKRGNSELYMLLERGINQLDSGYITNLIDDNTKITVEFSWDDFYSEYGSQITMFLIVIAVIIILLIVTYTHVRGKNLLRISRTDSLTNIMNRSGEQLIRERIEQNIGGMLCLIDVDKFKKFNDTYGHSAGDQVLIEIANGLKRVFRSDDLVVRLGGDEFAVFVSFVVDEEKAEPILDRLIAEIQAIQCEAVEEMPIQISVGVTFYHPEEKVEFEDLYKKADEACYEGKKEEGCSYKIQ